MRQGPCLGEVEPLGTTWRQRRAADTRRWRERLRRGPCVLPVEVDATTFDLMERFGGLKASEAGNRQHARANADI